jgi:hypothetical protein
LHAHATLWFILDPFRKVDPVTVNKFVQKVSITSKDNESNEHLMLVCSSHLCMIYVRTLLDQAMVPVPLVSERLQNKKFLLFAKCLKMFLEHVHLRLAKTANMTPKNSCHQN